MALGDLINVWYLIALDYSLYIFYIKGKFLEIEIAHNTEQTIIYERNDSNVV